MTEFHRDSPPQTREPARGGPPASRVLLEKRQEVELRLGLNTGAEEAYRVWHMALKARILVAGLKCLGLYERGRRNTRDFVFEEQVFTFPALPAALHGFRILHLSDFHLSRFDDQFAPAVETLLAGVEAELCLITGDYRYGYFGSCDHIYPVMQGVISNLRLTHGAYGVLGNHDISEMIAPLEATGMRVLMNEGVLLPIGSEGLWVGGVDDAHFFRCADVPASLEGAPEGAFKILLAHTPENGTEAAALGYNLCLCGHTHGGQLCLPFYGAVQTNARCPRELAVGRWRWGEMQGYTTRGLGTTDVPLRYNCRPEATLITLQPLDNNAGGS